MKSEFGKGLIVCLVKFAEHFEEIKRVDTSFHARMVMNGASDHLFEIEVPEMWKGTEIEAKVEYLQSIALEMGHDSFTTKRWTASDVAYVFSLCREIALLIDQKLGLDADMGEY